MEAIVAQNSSYPSYRFGIPEQLSRRLQLIVGRVRVIGDNHVATANSHFEHRLRHCIDLIVDGAFVIGFAIAIHSVPQFNVLKIP